MSATVGGGVVLPSIRRFIAASKRHARTRLVLSDDRTLEQMAAGHTCVVAGRGHRERDGRCRRCGREL